MAQSVLILGRQPALGLAELESLFGPSSTRPVGDNAVLIDADPSDIPYSRLGGTVKLARLLTILDTADWPEIEKYLTQTAPDHLKHVPEGKLTIGISAYGLAVSSRTISATGLSLKKAIRAAGRPVRIVPNKEPRLNTAQVLHNKLTGPAGWELLLIGDKKRTLLAQTAAVQDIEAYAARDQARPKRDARVGMLPPKLAQIIINLAVGPLHEPKAADATAGESAPMPVVLDPFCGTGVILQEAALMGYPVIGTDLEPRMVEYSAANLKWLGAKRRADFPAILDTADATSHVWPMAFSTIAAETYLGRPFSAAPKPETIRQVIQDVDTIHRKFLLNVAAQTAAGFRMCVAVPAWKINNRLRHLPTLENLDELGYTRLSFAHAANKEMVYHREGQIVARELVVLERK